MQACHPSQVTAYQQAKYHSIHFSREPTARRGSDAHSWSRCSLPLDPYCRLAPGQDAVTRRAACSLEAWTGRLERDRGASIRCPGRAFPGGKGACFSNQAEGPGKPRPM